MCKTKTVALFLWFSFSRLLSLHLFPCIYKSFSLSLSLPFADLIVTAINSAHLLALPNPPKRWAQDGRSRYPYSVIWRRKYKKNYPTRIGRQKILSKYCVGHRTEAEQIRSGSRGGS